MNETTFAVCVAIRKILLIASLVALAIETRSVLKERTERKGNEKEVEP